MLPAESTKPEVVPDVLPLGNQNLSNPEFLEYAFRSVLCRPPDDQGKADYLILLESTGDRSDVIRHLKASEEYSIRRSWEFAIVDVLQQPDNDAFLRKTYKVFLLREADVDGMTHYTRAINRGEKSRQDILDDILGSEEFHQKHANADILAATLHNLILVYLPRLIHPRCRIEKLPVCTKEVPAGIDVVSGNGRIDKKDNDASATVFSFQTNKCDAIVPNNLSSPWDMRSKQEKNDHAILGSSDGDVIALSVEEMDYDTVVFNFAEVCRRMPLPSERVGMVGSRAELVGPSIH